jgi:hypothetical protein
MRVRLQQSAAPPHEAGDDVQSLQELFAPEPSMPNSPKLPPEIVSRLRTLAHDLSNAIETILQASYLLGELNLEGPGKTWVTLIADAAQDAAHVNREIREALRTQ